MSGHATRPGDPGGQAVLEHCIQVAVSPIAGKHVASTSPGTVPIPPMEKQDVDVTVRKRNLTLLTRALKQYHIIVINIFIFNIFIFILYIYLI